jgi:DNA-binding MarR family transcriptional regulator
VAESGKFLKETEELRSLRALEEIERNPNISQRELASSLGVALGIANACVHALVRKGLIKIRGDNNRSISYHLTKKGIGAKSSLAVEWTKNTVDFYRLARQRVASELAEMAEKGARTVVLLGANEVSEIAALVAGQAGVKVLGIIRTGESYLGDDLLGIPVGELEDILAATRPDAVVACVEPTDEQRARVITALDRPDAESALVALTNRVYPEGSRA